MRISEFSLQRYGPLLESGRRKLGRFNLFYGPNEDGKTLTIDALVKLLLGRGLRLFNAINRVDESPEGYLVLEHKGAVLKLPEAGFLPGLLQISPEECRNIFVVRDSDLALARESDFYRGVAHRLTGLHSAEIGEITGKLRELGRLTPGHDFQNTSPLKLKSNLRKAGALVDSMGGLVERLERDGYDRAEQRLVDLKRQLCEKEQRLEQLEAARKRELFEKGSSALKILRSTLEKIAALRDFNSADEARWQHLLDNLAGNQEREKRLREELAREEELARRAAGRVKIAAAAVEEHLQRKELLVDRVTPLLKQSAELSCTLKKKEPASRRRFLGRTAIFSALLFLLALAGLLLRPSWWLYLFLAASGGILLYYGWLKIDLLRERGALAEINRELAFEAARLGFDASDPVELQTAIDEFYRGLEAAEKQLSEADKEAAVRKNICERLASELDGLLRQIDADRRSLRQLKEKLQVDTIEAYREKMRLKRDLLSKIDRQKAILESHFGDAEAGANLEKALAAWQKELSCYLPFREKALGLSYSEEQAANLKSERELLLEKRDTLGYRLEQYRDELRLIEKELNEILNLFGRSYLPCQTIPDLRKAVEELSCWVSAQKEKKGAAEAAIKIFNEIKLEEEIKIGELFDKESSVSDYYRRITGNRYQEVLFDSENKEIMVRCQDGSSLAASKLSGGAYDQLYFAIRLALGEKLLHGEKGFFILDDPFIKADPHRLAIQLEMLKTAVSRGWQVLYFSAKGEVKEALQKEINRGLVKLFTVS